LQAQIEKVVKEACDYLPGSVEGQCREFVDTYGNAVIALLAQEIDPSQVSCFAYRQTVHFNIAEIQKRRNLHRVLMSEMCVEHRWRLKVNSKLAVTEIYFCDLIALHITRYVFY
jgi:hypothetical protein